MRFVLTRRFERAYRGLPEDMRRKTEQALRLLGINLRHPSLHLKRLKGTPGIWEARVDKGCRMTLEIRGDAVILRNVGKHDQTLNSP